MTNSLPAFLHKYRAACRVRDNAAAEAETRRNQLVQQLVPCIEQTIRRRRGLGSDEVGDVVSEVLAMLLFDDFRSVQSEKDDWGQVLRRLTDRVVKRAVRAEIRSRRPPRMSKTTMACAHDRAAEIFADSWDATRLFVDRLRSFDSSLAAAVYFQEVWCGKSRRQSARELGLSQTERKRISDEISRLCGSSRRATANATSATENVDETQIPRTTTSNRPQA